MSRGQGRIEKRRDRDEKPSKVCPMCGRIFHWRKKWEAVWEEVRFCSDRCRGRRLGPVDEALEQAILELTSTRGASATICPSEATRAAFPDTWESLKDATRDAARRLADQGRIEILQGGRVIDPSEARGAIRLRIRR